VLQEARLAAAAEPFQHQPADLVVGVAGELLEVERCRHLDPDLAEDALKQLREQARNILREQKFEAAFAEWLRDLRGRAYVEYREPPQ